MTWQERVNINFCLPFHHEVWHTVIYSIQLLYQELGTATVPRVEKYEHLTNTAQRISVLQKAKAREQTSKRRTFLLVVIASNYNYTFISNTDIKLYILRNYYRVCSSCYSLGPLHG